MEKKYVYRSAVTGKFVTKEYADEHPATTIRQEIETKQGGQDE